MRPYPQVESSAPSSPMRSLPPALTQALASLDIQLEEELMRYRRLRSGIGQPARSGNRKQSRKSPDLMSVPAANGRTQPGDTPLPSAPVADQSRPDPEVSQSDSFQNTSAGQSVPPYSTQPPAFVSDPNTSELAIAGLLSDEPLAAAAEAPKAHLSPKTGEDRSLLVPPLNHRLDDYLESSEELLRSLADEEAEVQSERGFMQSLLTPLGVGSMLLLLISSAMFGYVLMNPSSLARLFSSNGSKTAGNPSDPNSQAALVSPQPNLANQEFKDLNLGTLGTLKDEGGTPSKRASNSNTSPALPAKPSVSPPGGVSASSAPSIPPPNSQGSSTGSFSSPLAPAQNFAPSATLPVQPAPPVRVVDPPQPARLSLPGNNSRSPATSYNPSSVKTPLPAVPSSPVAPSNSSSVSPANGAYQYKVEIQYDNDRTLETVKKVVPDAYLRNFPDGARIQAGASTNAAEAEAKAQELRDQGIPAEVNKR